MKQTARLVAVIVGASLLASPVGAQTAGSAGPDRRVAQSESFSPMHGRAGQPVARNMRPDEAALQETAVPSGVPPVPTGVHLSPLAPILGPRPADVGEARRREVLSDTGKAGARESPSPATSSRRRANCTEILQRATIGELSEEDRAILRTQCR